MTSNQTGADIQKAVEDVDREDSDFVCTSTVMDHLRAGGNKRKNSDNKVQKEEGPENRPPKRQRYEDFIYEMFEEPAMKYLTISQLYVYLQRALEQVFKHVETLNRLATSPQCTLADVEALQKVIKNPCNYVVCGDTPFENVQIGGGSSNYQPQKGRKGTKKPMKERKYWRKIATKLLIRAKKTLFKSRKG